MRLFSVFSSFHSLSVRFIFSLLWHIHTSLSEENYLQKKKNNKQQRKNQRKERNEEKEMRNDQEKEEKINKLNIFLSSSPVLSHSP